MRGAAPASPIQSQAHDISPADTNIQIKIAARGHIQYPDGPYVPAVQRP